MVLGLKRNEIMALLFVVFVGALLRYPRFPNEFAGDTLEMHFFTDAIRQTGTAGFVMSPWSWFGVYPVSYPLGVPITAATLGHLAGLQSEDAISLIGVMTGVLGTLGSFCLAQRLTGNAAVGLLCAAAFATSGYHVSQSIAGMSGRAMVMALFPVVLLAFSVGTFGRISQPRVSAIVIMPLLFALNFAMAASHRLFFLALLTQVVVVAGLAVYRWIVAAIPEQARRLFPSGLLVLVATGVLLVLGIQALDVGPRSGPVFLAQFLNAADRQVFTLGYLIEQAYNIGPLLPLAAFGLWAAAGEGFRWTRMLQVLTVAFGALFFVAVPSFTVVVLSPFFGIVIGIGWSRVRALQRRPRAIVSKGASVVLVAVLGLCLVLPGYFVYETQRANRGPDGTSFYTDQESVESGVFLHLDSPSRAFITPDLTDARRVMADGQIATVSSETTLFIVQPDLKDKILISYRYEGANVLELETLGDVFETFLQSKTLFVSQDWIIPGGGYGVGGHWGAAVTLQPSSGRILDEYGSNHVLTNNFREAHPIAKLVRANYYVEYSNWLESVYMIQLGNGCVIGQRGCA